MKIRRLRSHDSNFQYELELLLDRVEIGQNSIAQSAAAIVTQVREQGVSALLSCTQQFDRVAADSLEELRITPDDLAQAWQAITDEQRRALETAKQRISDYHERQFTACAQSWSYVDALGAKLGQRTTALDRVGVYVPGGLAAYPSSVLMNVLPAHVAGVPDIVMVVPTPDGRCSPLVMAAAHLCGVQSCFRIGGAQAIAALAYGCEGLPAVDKIVGPGNAYVAAAKRLVFGACGIDMIAGPSEILIVADGSTDPKWAAADLFSQAEHDENAQALLLCPDPVYLDRVEHAMHALLPELDRAETIMKSISDRGALIETQDLDQACVIANRIAAEHLEIHTETPQTLLDQIKHAGAIFVGKHACETLGDYCAGPNHVLPTSGTARFSSALGVYDFVKRNSIIDIDAEVAKQLAPVAEQIAEGEGLQAHALAARLRQ